MLVGRSDESIGIFDEAHLSPRGELEEGWVRGCHYGPIVGEYPTNRILGGGRNPQLTTIDDG